jgi:hypothetical protein
LALFVKSLLGLVDSACRSVINCRIPFELKSKRFIIDLIVCEQHFLMVSDVKGRGKIIEAFFLFSTYFHIDPLVVRLHQVGTFRYHLLPTLKMGIVITLEIRPRHPSVLVVEQKRDAGA